MARNMTGVGFGPIYSEDRPELRLTAPFTVGFWWNSGAQEAFAYLMSKVLVPDSFSSYAIGCNGSGQLRALVGWDADTSSFTVTDAIDTSSIFNNQWHHLAVSYDQSFLKLWVDGVAAASVAETNPVDYSDERFVIGSFDGTQLQITSGSKVAELAMWNTVLTTADFASITKGFSPSLVRPDKLQEHWPMLGRNEAGEIGSRKSTFLDATLEASWTPHPRIFLPATPIFKRPTPADDSPQVEDVDQVVENDVAQDITPVLVQRVPDRVPALTSSGVLVAGVRGVPVIDVVVPGVWVYHIENTGPTVVTARIYDSAHTLVTSGTRTFASEATGWYLVLTDAHYSATGGDEVSGTVGWSSGDYAYDDTGYLPQSDDIFTIEDDGGIYRSTNDATYPDNVWSGLHGVALAYQAVDTIVEDVAQVVENDVAQAIEATKLRQIGQVTENDVAQAIKRLKLKVPTQVVENDVAQTITPIKVARVGQVVENDIALSLVGAAQPVDQVIENDTALPIKPARIVKVGQVVENDIPISMLHRVKVTYGVVYDLHRLISKTAGLLFDVNKAIHTSSSLEYDVLKSVSRPVELKYDVRTEVPVTTTELEYDVEQQVAKTSSLLYDVQQVGTTQVLKTFGVRYHTLKIVTDPAVGGLRAEGFVENDFTAGIYATGV